MRVSDIMNKAVVVEDDINLRVAAKIMSNKNIGSLIVMSKNKIVGIISERDVMKNVSKLGEKISQVMTKEVVTVDAGDNIENAALVMAKNKIKRLPVLKKGELVGIVTATDILANSDSINDEFLLD